MDRNEIRQSHFNTVVNHLRAQGKPCADYDRVSYYRRGDNRCAIGCLIPDNEYKNEFERMSLSDLYANYPNIPIFQKINSDIDFYIALQCVHDNSDPDYWEYGFAAVAKSYNLTVPAI